VRYANHSGWYTSHALVVPACEPLYGAQLRIESDQPLTFSDQHSPRLSAFAQLYENAKLLVCCTDSLFGLDVRRIRCVVLSSLHPSHFFSQKSTLSTSAMHALL
jgi:hypothetical protein